MGYLLVFGVNTDNRIWSVELIPHQHRTTELSETLNTILKFDIDRETIHIQVFDYTFQLLGFSSFRFCLWKPL
jgi:hypothetical protein